MLCCYFAASALSVFQCNYVVTLLCKSEQVQCSVSWVTERASCLLKKLGVGFVGGDDLAGAEQALSPPSLCSSKSQHGGVLVPAYLGCHGEWPFNKCRRCYYVDPRVADYFLMSSPWSSLIICILYVILVEWALPRVMHNRPPMEFRRLMTAYNFAMVLLSGYIFIEVRMQKFNVLDLWRH